MNDNGMKIEYGKIFDSKFPNESKVKHDTVPAGPISECKWNVIREEEFKERTIQVFKQVAGALSKTLGPYGSTTIIEKFGEMYITKDGWQVLKNIHFDSTLDNNILMLLTRISIQLVLKVGDGSTSSIIAADAILDRLTSSEYGKEISKFKALRPKEQLDMLNHCVKELSDIIYASALEVNKDTLEEIYQIAHVATNGDEKISNIIRDIYKETNNPTIEYTKSKTDKTTYEIVDGYKANITYLDPMYATNDEGECVLSNPIILMFDHKIDMETSLPIIGDAVTKAVDDNKRLVVIAPYYDKRLLDYIRKNATIEYRSRGITTIVYARVSLVNNLLHTLYDDFAIMTGGEVIREQYLDNYDKSDLDTYLGTVDGMVISPSDTFIKGFNHRNDAMYNAVVDNAKMQFNKLSNEYKEKGLVDTKLNDYKQRVSKLRGKMGVIRVGGYSTLEKSANFDLVEDAVKACESAYNYGYNVGGGLAIPYYVNKLLDQFTDGDKISISEEEEECYRLFSSSFCDIFTRIIRNKTDALSYDFIYNTIIKRAISYYDGLMGYNIITEEFSNDIINPCVTDVEILKAAVSIISLIISSNQYISIVTESYR